MCSNLILIIGFGVVFPSYLSAEQTELVRKARIVTCLQPYLLGGAVPAHHPGVSTDKAFAITKTVTIAI